MPLRESDTPQRSRHLVEVTFRPYQPLKKKGQICQKAGDHRSVRPECVRVAKRSQHSLCALGYDRVHVSELSETLTVVPRGSLAPAKPQR